MNNFCVLNNLGAIVPCLDGRLWARWMSESNTTVACTSLGLGPNRVETVFTGRLSGTFVVSVRNTLAKSCFRRKSLHATTLQEALEEHDKVVAEMMSRSSS